MDQIPQTQLDSEVRTGAGVSVRRFFTTPREDPFDLVEWELRDARIGHGDKVSFEQREVEFPKAWSQNATNIVAQKYFRGRLSAPERERSVRQMITRVAGTVASWGAEGGYFAGDEDRDTFEAEERRSKAAGKQLARLEGHKYVSYLTFSADGKRLASGDGWDPSVRVWQLYGPDEFVKIFS